MFNTLKELPLRAFVSMQSNAVAASESPKTGIVPRTSRDRLSLALGGMLASLAYAATVPAIAAPKGGGTSSFLNVLATFTKFAIILVGSISVLMAVAAGLMFITSGGNSRMISRAKDTIKYVVIGLVLVGGLWVLNAVIGAVVDPGGNNKSLNDAVQGGVNNATNSAKQAPLQ